MVRGEGEGIRAPSHPLQALLGASQTAFCASPGQVAGPVPRWLMVSIDNTSSPLSAPFLKSRINKLKDYCRTGKEAKNMPKLLRTRAPQDKAEEQNVRKLANSRHAPGDWIMRARMIARSWDGRGTKAIAEELGCHPQTVRERIHRFNDEGFDGLGDRPGAGRKRRITETERSLIIWLVGTHPPGRLLRGAGGELEATDEQREAHWTLDALTTAARGRREGFAVVRYCSKNRLNKPNPWIVPPRMFAVVRAGCRQTVVNRRRACAE